MAGQRAHGTGSIRLRKDGRWEGKYYDATGKRRSVMGKTEREVEKKLRQAIAAAERGEAPTNQRLAVATYLTEWLETVVLARVAYRTLDSYRREITNHLIPALGAKRLTTLTPTDVQRYLNEKLAAGLSKRTVSYHRAILRRALNDALRHGHVHRNVVTLTDPPGQDRREQRWLDADEAQRFIGVARKHRLSALWVLAVTSGMRKGELLGIRWEDVDLDAGVINVRVQLQRIDGQLQLRPLKTEKAKRPVYLTDIAHDALREHRRLQAAERLRAGEHWHDADLVFATPLGTPVDGRNVTRAFEQLLRAAGLPRIRFHDLRHSAASIMVAQGLDTRMIADQLGHAQITLTLDTYAHVAQKGRREAVAKLDDAFRA